MSQGQQTKQDLLIAIVVSIALVWLSNIAIQYLFFDDFTTAISSKTEQLSQMVGENQKLTVMQANLNTLENNGETLSVEYKQLNSLIPEEKELPDILEYLYKAGLSRNLKLSHFSQSQKIARVGALNQLPITVSVTGSDDNIRRYVNDFIRFKRILSVDSVEITKIPNQKPQETPEKAEKPNQKIDETYSAEIKFSAFLSDPKYDPKDKVTKN